MSPHSPSAVAYGLSCLVSRLPHTDCWGNSVLSKTVSHKTCGMLLRGMDCNP